MRKAYLDNIRWSTVVLVVLYHVIYMYNAEGVAGVVGRITPEGTIQYQDVYQYLVYPWFMVLLFIVSGMSTRYYLEAHTIKEFVKSRTIRLLVPSTIGLFVFQWIQGYFNMAIPNAFDNIPNTVPGFVLYFIMALSGIGVLWFLQLLWVFSMLLALIRRFEKGRLYEVSKKANLIVLIALMIPMWGAAQILNTPVIVSYRCGIYVLAFLLGYFLFAHEEVTDRLKDAAVWLMICAIVLAGLYAWRYFGENYAIDPILSNPFSIGFAWIACLAVLGGFKRFYDRRTKFSQWMGARSFGLYVFHYLFISGFAYFSTRYLTLPVPLTYLLTTILGFGGAYLTYEVLSRIPFIRWAVLGIRKR